MSFFDLVVYGLLILAFLLFNWLPQWLKHRRQHNDATPAEPAPPLMGGLDAQWGRIPPPPARGPSTPGPSAADTRKHATHSWAERDARPRVRRVPRLHGPKDLRDAIVLTAILGPCRAQEPYGSKEP